MTTYRSRLLTGTVIPVALGAGLGLAGTIAFSGQSPAAANGAPSVASATAPLPRARSRAVQVAACNPCAVKNPCAAKNRCAANPCAAKNPCAANPCNPCAGAAAGASSCLVPRLARANPCAAQNPCAAKSPCAANPCAAKNPCAANPCAAKNPCAAANPCGAANPCNPCAAGDPVELTDAEAAKAYDCILPALKTAYGKSGHSAAKAYATWRRYSRIAYTSATHGGRFVNNYANEKGRKYAGFENAGVMPEGTVLAKDSFTVSKTGGVGVGPLFLMEKMGKGFNKASGDWRYTMIMPTGAVFGVTNGKNSAGMEFCTQCHAAVGETQDHMFFLPTEYRAK